jgi:hypothetical protein
MEKIIEKIADFSKALKTLEKILKKFYEFKAIYRAHLIRKTLRLTNLTFLMKKTGKLLNIEKMKKLVFRKK